MITLEFAGWVVSGADWLKLDIHLQYWAFTPVLFRRHRKRASTHQVNNRVTAAACGTTEVGQQQQQQPEVRVPYI